MKRRWFAPSAAVLLALLPGGCGGRNHLTPSHGRAVRQSIVAQTANPEAGSQPHRLPGLDAQEANIVVKNYRRALAGKTERSEDGGGLLMLAPPQAPAQPYLPPPSVPQERR
jgi:type IV pilus biogenesis protein CpaD/CtpE